MKKIKIFILLFLSIIGLVGCGKQDINKLVFISAMGFDKDEDGFKLVAQVVNKVILDPDPPQVAPVFVVTAKGETVFDCFKNLSNLLPNRPYLINLQLLLFDEELAKEGIKEYVHFFVNFAEAQHEYNIMVTKGITVEKFLGQLSVFSHFPTRVLIEKLETAIDYHGFGKKTYIEMLYSAVMDEKETLILSSVEVLGDLEEGETIDHNKKTKIASEIKIADLAVFDEDRLVGWLNKEEAVVYNLVMNKIKRTVFVVNGENNNKISNIVKNASSKVDVKFENNNPKVKIDVKFDIDVIEDTQGKIPLDLKYLEYIQKQLEKQVKDQIIKCIEKSKNELEVDIFSISGMIYKKNPNWWKENKDNYKEIYKQIDFEVNVKPNIRRLDI